MREELKEFDFQRLWNQAAIALAKLQHTSNANATNAATRATRVMQHAQLSKEEYNALVLDKATKLGKFIKDVLSGSKNFSQETWGMLLGEVKMKPESVTHPIQDLGYLSVLHHLISIAKQTDANKMLQDLIAIDSVDLESAQNQCLITPLALCVKSEASIVAGQLLEKGCKVDPVDLSGETPFIKSVRLQRGGVIDLLLEYKADVNKVTQDKSKVTAIFFAAMQNDAYTLEKLIHHGATDYKSKIGSSVEVAMILGNLKALKILIGYNFSVPNIENYEPSESLLEFVKSHDTSFEYEALSKDINELLTPINEYDRFYEKDYNKPLQHIHNLDRLKEARDDNPVLALRILKKAFGCHNTTFKNLEDHIKELENPNIALVAYASILAKNESATSGELLTKLGISFPSDDNWELVSDDSLKLVKKFLDEFKPDQTVTDSGFEIL